MKREEYEKVMTAITGYPCKVVKKKEITYSVDLFNVPREKKDEIQDLAHASADVIEKLTGDNLFSAVIVVTPEETQRYYPEKKGLVAEKQDERVESFADFIRKEALKEIRK